MAITDMVQTAAILVSVLGLLYQLRREWLLHSAEMVTSLVAQFNSEDFEKRRRRLAVHLETVATGGNVSLTSDYGLGVLGFYENLSHLVRRRALDEKMIWTKFSWELVCYFQCITMNGNALAVERTKNGDPTLYEEMEWLNKRFVRTYRRRGVSLYRDDGKIRWIEDFFVQEKNLCSSSTDFGPSTERATRVASRTPETGTGKGPLTTGRRTPASTGRPATPSAR
ncbi:MAG TPA: hypothetical protein VLB76_19975 [Thermoanaerobaculia bacterium]|jgi:hypothetical protein|nr:hypothetical protein [Thermoanaerobaculia bacterium]